MSTLVVYASKHGATQGIAKRIAAKLRQAGQQAQARPVAAVDHLTGYDAFVVGSAVYAAHWQKEASAFIRRNLAHHCTSGSGSPRPASYPPSPCTGAPSPSRPAPPQPGSASGS
jgi:menaquinone-dependent protoporphyrinogen IX oxidase